jgi:sister-chromatid-cohesion protein PDS5
MAEYILPLPAIGSNTKGNDTDESAWTDRLLNTMKYMDETAIKALLTLTGLKPM